MSTSVDIQLDRAIADRIAVAQEARLRQDGKGAFSVTYIFGDSGTPIDFGANGSDLIAPPAGVRGEIKDLNLYDVTETFNQVTAPLGAGILIGTAADTDAYATSAKFGTLASAAAEDFALTDGVTTVLPADTDILVTYLASDHGTPAGIAVVALTINYFV